MAEFEFGGQALGLSKSINAHLEAHGEEAAKEIIAQAEILLEWIGYLNAHKKTGVADHLLSGIRSLVLESIAATSAGLYRSAILSMRGQIDLALAWVYFKDHPVEWDLVKSTNDGFKLKKEIFEYLFFYSPSFKERWRILSNFTVREVEDPFRILSAHIHGMGESAIPTVANFSDIVGSKDISKDCVKLQINVFSYMSDIFLAQFGQDWIALPEAILKYYKAIYNSEQIARLGT